MERALPELRGYISLVLHAHLPYIRYPENKHHLEERWFYEAITETYIPLLKLFGDLINDRVNFRATLSLTPTLIEMFRDELLMDRYRQHLGSLIELSEKEVARNARKSSFVSLAKMYRKRFLKVRNLFEDTYRRDLTSAFRGLSDSGKIEIIASTATHSFLPALMSVPEAQKTQILLGIEHYRKTFGRNPEGMWLPECGFTPEIDNMLKTAGIRYFFLESHGLLNCTPKCRYSIYTPVKTPSGIFAFSRDVRSSRQVWSSLSGYPGDFYYRDFFRDIGFDLDMDYIKPYVPDGIRTFTGMKYYRITGRHCQKKPYVRKMAMEKTRIHADHFIGAKVDQTLYLKNRLGIRPVITAAYDAELFGHWWFEGPEWLNFLFRRGARQKVLSFISPSQYLSQEKNFYTSMPSLSSWGERGYSSVWINPSNDWLYRHLHHAGSKMVEMSRKYSGATGARRRALNQAARELLLAQASDWPFMIKTGNASWFAKKKFTEHINNFLELEREIRSGRIDNTNLSVLENKNNIFADIDFEIFST